MPQQKLMQLLQKRFLKLYLEHLTFVIKWASWEVTKIHAHLTFEEKRLIFSTTLNFLNKYLFWWIKNRDKNPKIILKKFSINWWIIQILATVVKAILTIVNLFLYLMNIKKMHMLEDILTFLIQGVSQFVMAHLIWQEIAEKYSDKLIKLDNEDKFSPLRLNSLNAERLKFW